MYFFFLLMAFCFSSYGGINIPEDLIEKLNTGAFECNLPKGFTEEWGGTFQSHITAQVLFQRLTDVTDNTDDYSYLTADDLLDDPLPNHGVYKCTLCTKDNTSYEITSYHKLVVVHTEEGLQLFQSMTCHYSLEDWLTAKVSNEDKRIKMFEQAKVEKESSCSQEKGELPKQSNLKKVAESIGCNQCMHPQYFKKHFLTPLHDGIKKIGIDNEKANEYFSSIFGTQVSPQITDTIRPSLVPVFGILYASLKDEFLK